MASDLAIRLSKAANVPVDFEDGLSLLSVQGSVGSHKKENRPTLREILPLLRRRPDMS